MTYSYLEDPEGAENFEVLLPPERPYEILRAAHEPPPKHPEDYAGILISGSAAMLTAAPDWLGPLADFVRRGVEGRVPTFGICFGHQLIAAACCGPDAVRKAAEPEVGWDEIELTGEDPIAAELPQRFTTFLSHYEEVRPGLPGIEVFARSRRCAVQALRVGDAPAWGVQFHPEMRAAETEHIVRITPGRRPSMNFDVEAELAKAVDSAPLARQLMANFLAAVDEG